MKKCCTAKGYGKTVGLGRSLPLAQRLFRGAHRSRSCHRTDCKRGSGDAATSVLSWRVTDGNVSVKWCGVTLYRSATFNEANSRAKPDDWRLGSLKRARNPKRKGKGLQSLIWWFNSIPRLHLPLVIPRSLNPHVFALLGSFDLMIFLRMKTVACGLSLYRSHRSYPRLS